MTFTYTPTTDIGRIRRTVPGERSVTTYSLTDEELQSYLDDYENDWRLASAAAMDYIASDQALVMKVTSSLGYSVNGVSVADFLKRQADELRRQVREDLSGDSVQIIPLFRQEWT